MSFDLIAVYVGHCCSSLHAGSSNCGCDEEGTGKYMERVELAVFEIRERREWLSTFDPSQGQEQLCEPDLYFLIRLT